MYRPPRLILSKVDREEKRRARAAAKVAKRKAKSDGRKKGCYVRTN
jgi:hypothetical protein